MTYDVQRMFSKVGINLFKNILNEFGRYYLKNQINLNINF